MSLAILYIGGIGRSGSSMLERLLDGYDGVVSLGEIHQIFSHWLQFDKRQYCGCGEQFQHCPFWREVLARSIGPMASFDPAAWSWRRRQVIGDHHRRELLFGRQSRAYSEALGSFLAALASFYSAIAEVSGARVIVDSSKMALWAVALARMPDTEVRFLHFVRNPYATAFSWQRRRKMPEIWWEDRYMPTFGADEIGRRWRAALVTSFLAAPRMHRYKRVHYEDFVRNPDGVLRQIEEFGGFAPPDRVGRLTDRTADLSPGHTIMGNPMRLQKRIEIREDAEWRQGLSAADCKAVRRRVWSLRPFFRA